MSSYSFRLASVSIGLLLVLGFSSFFLVQTDNDSYNMAELLKREWVEVSQRDSSLNELRVLSFNVLADGLSQHGNFVKADPAQLEWDSRFPLLLAEIERAQPDIGGLAECNNAEAWQEALSQAGYKSIVVAKDSAPAARFGATPDGCCVFFKADRFNLVREETHGTGPVQVILHLEDSSGRAHIVSMHHLKAKRGKEAIRTEQAKAVVTRVTAAREEAAAADKLSPIVLVMGDFNAHYDEDCVQRCMSELSLASAYGEDAPSWTTWKYRQPSDFDAGGLQKHTIDFILHSSQIRVSQTWGLPSDDELVDVGLPQAKYGSDHIAVAAVFEVL